MLKGLKLKGKALANRLTGFSSPIVGLNWTPPVDEQDKARRLLVYLEDRRALFHPYEMEIGDYVDRSVLDIRQRLTTELEDLPKSSPLAESLGAMRAACRKFLDGVQGSHSRHMGLGPLYAQCIGELRAIFGVHIAKIALIYDLEVSGDLVSILPADTAEDG